MNKEYFQNRIQSLQQNMKMNEQMVVQATANANACAGAIQECEVAIKQLEEANNAVSQGEGCQN
jgi:hypothetical protein